MYNELPREAYSDRPKLDLTEAAQEIRFNPDTPFRIHANDFIALIKRAYGFKVTRRTLQLYSSPQVRLLPPPVHIGGHTSYYLHPEHTEQLAVILHLSSKHFMPLKEIRTLLRGFPERHYSILLKDVFSATELDQVEAHSGRGFEIKDFLFYKITRILRALDESEESEALLETFRDKEGRERVLLRMFHEFEQWFHSERRHRVDTSLREHHPKPKEF